MKIYLLFPLFIFTSCSSKKIEQNFLDSTLQTSNSKTQIIYHKANDYPILGKIPNGFTIDSLKIRSKKNNFELSIFTPKSSIARFNTIISKRISVLKNRWLTGLTDEIQKDKEALKAVPAFFSIRVHRIYKDSTVISVLFSIEDAFFSAVHPVTSYFSVNYDLKTGKELHFSDFFALNTSNDSLNFKKIIDSELYDNLTVLNKNLNDLDFNVEKDTISFNFSDYEIAGYSEGILRSKIVKSKISKYIVCD